MVLKVFRHYGANRYVYNFQVYAGKEQYDERGLV